MSSLYPKLLVFLQFSIIGIMVLLSHGFFSHIYALILFSLGACIGVWAINHNKLDNFNIQPKYKEGSYLVTTGIYKYIRHPMYTSVILMMLAFFITTPTWIEGLLLLMLIVVLILKAKREEKGLIDAHPEYQNYQDNTKYFIPYIL